jgi:hypothetical protein
MLFVAAADHRATGGAAAVELLKPPLRTTVPLATSPEKTSSRPPLLTTVPLATPPEETKTLPPLLTAVPLAVPPAMADSALTPRANTPPRTIVALATPPLRLARYRG